MLCFRLYWVNFSLSQEKPETRDTNFAKADEGFLDRTYTGSAIPLSCQTLRTLHRPSPNESGPCTLGYTGHLFEVSKKYEESFSVSFWL